MPGKEKPIDGISLMPVVEGRMGERPKPIPFCSYYFDKKAAHGSPVLALVDNNYKFFTSLSKDGREDMLYDLAKDPWEENNIVKDPPELAAQMKQTLREWITSCKSSHSGADYDVPFTPVNRFPRVTDDGLRR